MLEKTKLSRFCGIILCFKLINSYIEYLPVPATVTTEYGESMYSSQKKKTFLLVGFISVCSVEVIAVPSKVAVSVTM